MLFTTQPQTADHIRAFCARFNEGFRVEYKATFDANVRRNLPKVVSSFSNSLGGVLVVGVQTAAGVPQPPIEGFEPQPGEELPLTVQNICLQNIYPPVFPRCYLMTSDIAGRAFLVVEVEESWEAPHAIENSKKVFVRTGEAANPYDLGNVDLIIELIKRRQEPLQLRERLLIQARRHAQIPVADTEVFFELSIGPSYPRRPICSSDEAWEFLEQSLYRGGRFFPLQILRRIADGAGAFGDHEYGEVSRFGLIVGRNQLHPQVRPDLPAAQQVPYLLLRDVFRPLFKLIICAARFYERVGYRGNVSIHAALHNTLRQRFVFIPVQHFDFTPNDFLCFDDFVVAEQTVAAENLQIQREQLLQELLAQICWSFWQSNEPFPAETLREYLGGTIAAMGAV